MVERCPLPTGSNRRRHDGYFPQLEPLPRTPLVLLQEHGTKLGQRVRPRTVERPQDTLAIFDGERDDSGLERERLLKKRARRFIHEPYELADIVLEDPQAGEIYRRERTRGEPLLAARTMRRALSPGRATGR